MLRTCRTALEIDNPLRGGGGCLSGKASFRASGTTARADRESKITVRVEERERERARKRARVKSARSRKDNDAIKFQVVLPVLILVKFNIFMSTGAAIKKECKRNHLDTPINPVPVSHGDMFAEYTYYILYLATIQTCPLYVLKYFTTVNAVLIRYLHCLYQ